MRIGHHEELPIDSVAALPPLLGAHFDVEHSTLQFEPTSHADHEHAADAWARRAGRP